MKTLPHVLNSWKEIAAYLGRSERTCQRWEEDFGLPVHRPAKRMHSAVIAIPKELDRWVQSAPTGADMRNNKR